MPIDSGKSFVLDFSNVKDQSGFNPSHMPAGDYEGLVKDAEYSDSRNNNPMVTYAVALTERPSAVYRYNCVLTEASLWKLRNLVVAAGKNIPKKKLKLSAAVLNSIIGKTIGITLEDDEYEGKMRSQIVGCFPAADLADDNDVDEDDVEDPEEDETEEPAPKKTAAKKTTKKAPAKKAVEEEDEDLDELDIDDL